MKFPFFVNDLDLLSELNSLYDRPDVTLVSPKDKELARSSGYIHWLRVADDDRGLILLSLGWKNQPRLLSLDL